MRRRLLLTSLTLATLAPTLWEARAQAAPAASTSDSTPTGRCKVRLYGSTSGSNSCGYDIAEDGSFELWPNPPSNFYVAIDIDHGSATARTNGGKKLGVVKKRGACWLNPKVEICLWRT